MYFSGGLEVVSSDSALRFLIKVNGLWVVGCSECFLACFYCRPLFTASGNILPGIRLSFIVSTCSIDDSVRFSGLSAV